MLDRLQHADFLPLVGHAFRMEIAPGQDLDLTLAEVKPLGEVPPPPRRQAFSLIFVSTGPGHQPQRIYSVTHPSLGTLELFLVPVGPGSGGMRYEAVFG